MKKITADDLNMDEVTQEVIEHIGWADGSHLVFFDDGTSAILQGGDWYGDEEKLLDVPVSSYWWRPTFEEWGVDVDDFEADELDYDFVYSIKEGLIDDLRRQTEQRKNEEEWY